MIYCPVLYEPKVKARQLMLIFKLPLFNVVVEKVDDGNVDKDPIVK